MRKPVVCVGNGGDWDASRGCIADTCDNSSVTTSYEESEWRVIACHYPDLYGRSGPGYEPNSNPDCSVDIDSINTYTSNCPLVAIDTELYPQDLEVAGNFPNPFNPSTTIQFSILTRQDVTIRIFDTRGRLMQNLHYSSLPQGQHEARWDATEVRGRSVPSGVYLYTVNAGDNCRSGKMVYLK